MVTCKAFLVKDIELNSSTILQSSLLAVYMGKIYSSFTVLLWPEKKIVFFFKLNYHNNGCIEFQRKKSL